MPVPYPGWNVVYGEIPAASKWSQLGSNDDALAAGSGINDGAIITRHLAPASVVGAKMAPGAVVQVVGTQFSALVTGTAVIPLDDTIPQIGEGFEVMTQAITPISATNKLIIEVVTFIAMSASDFPAAAIFRDATANALGATNFQPQGSNSTGVLTLTVSTVAGSVSPTTFRVRIGPINATTTLTFNGRAGVRLYGGVADSFIKVTEVVV